MNKLTEKQEKERFDALINFGYYCDEYGNVFTQRHKRISSNRSGYLYGHSPYAIGKWQFYCHRFIWYFFKGELPNTINHINGIRFDNRLENLESIERNVNNTLEKRTKLIVDGIVQFSNCYKIYSYNRVIGEESTYQNALLLRNVLLYNDKESKLKLELEKELEEIWMQ